MTRLHLLIILLFTFSCTNAQKKDNWFDTAVIYQVTPYIFTDSCQYPDIETKLPELAALGINTIYLQPVFKTHRGKQGYDITDYFQLRDDLGNEQQLHSLIKAAKALSLRVLFDMVPNHTSIHHPYAQDVIARGSASQYYEFYQHEFDSALYSEHYHKDSSGFIYYFWKDLINLNYNNEKVQQWMIDACKHWIQKYDIDGYRFDAIWGVNARAPEFAKRLLRELKQMKPDLLLLAEDKATRAETYRLGYDAAYDWDKETAWVSKWVWQYEYDKDHSHTLFNHPSMPMRRQLLQNSLFMDGDSIGLRLRYLENNDMHRFITNHSLAVTKMAATLMFTIHGIPMLFNGQEIGCKVFPYRPVPIFKRDSSIRSLNPALFDLYENLIRLRREHPALSKGTIRELKLPGEAIVAFQRLYRKEEMVVIVNLGADPVELAIKGTFKDLLNGNTTINGKKIAAEGYSTTVLLRIK